MCDKLTIAETVDATGLTCPLPLLKAKQGLKSLRSGECLKVLATDPGSERDFEVFANLSGNSLVQLEKIGDTFTYVLQKI
ncbi:sulfurtransferase TusA family protein [Aurantivibrio plasticivorans]